VGRRDTGIRYRRGDGRRGFESSVSRAVAVAVLVAPVPFFVSVIVGAFFLSSRGGLGQLGTAVVSFTGGLVLGTMVLVDADLLRLAPLLVLVGVVIGRLRARRRWTAGWVLVGGALPWTLLYGLITAVMLAGDIPYSTLETLGLFALGIIPFAAGIVLVERGDPPAAEARMDARAGQPGSRDIGSIAHAIREPSFVGPFGLQEISLLVAIIAALTVASFIVRDLHVVLRVVLTSAAAAVLGTEAYIRVMTTRSRRAFEAFSWLGEWELARAKRAVGRLPLSRDDAMDWLVAHPLGPIAIAEELPVRIEIELLAGRRDEARALLEQLPASTPWERFELAALRDLVDWRAGGDGFLELMQESAREILPSDGDERLRAEVTIAVAQVRRRMADGRVDAGDAALPLVEIRDRLGARADGQVGRALRGRLIPQLFFLGLILTTVGEVAGLQP
jgi:hypothetical protein